MQGRAGHPKQSRHTRSSSALGVPPMSSSGIGGTPLFPLSRPRANATIIGRREATRQGGGSRFKVQGSRPRFESRHPLFVGRCPRPSPPSPALAPRPSLIDTPREVWYAAGCSPGWGKVLNPRCFPILWEEGLMREESIWCCSSGWAFGWAGPLLAADSPRGGRRPGGGERRGGNQRRGRPPRGNTGRK